MIKGISGSQGLQVSGGSATLPYIPPNPSNPMQGMIRFNNSEMEVFNGTSWQTIYGTYATIGFDQETQDLLQWARSQRTMALNRMTLAQNNPALMKALEAVKRAEDNFELLAKFVEHDQPA
jgi:hypothetical protein